MMAAPRVCLVLLVACSTCLLCEGATSWLHNQYHASWGLHIGYKTYARNEQDCIASCYRDVPACTAATYVGATWECFRSDTIRPVFQQMLPTTSLFINIPRVKAWLSTEGYYPLQVADYTYADAVARCQVWDGRLMNVTEFTDLYNAGENMCDCAWLEGGAMMYGSQAANVTDCGVQLAGLGSCSDNLAHAWCVPNYTV